jgi:hypothetical protein
LDIWHAWERRNAYRGLVGTPEGKIGLRRLRRWEGDIKMDFKYT